MPSIPTPGAPKTYDDLVALLEHDNKVKVAGQSFRSFNIPLLHSGLTAKSNCSFLVAGVDVDGVLRGKFMSKAKFLSAAKSEFGFCSVILYVPLPLPPSSLHTRLLILPHTSPNSPDSAAGISTTRPTTRNSPSPTAPTDTGTSAPKSIWQLTAACRGRTTCPCSSSLSETRIQVNPCMRARGACYRRRPRVSRRLVGIKGGNVWLGQSLR
jgi:hypothetical protein